MGIELKQRSYLDGATSQLVRTREKMSLLRRTVDDAVAVGSIADCEQLGLAMELAEHYLNLAWVRLEGQRRAGVDSFDTHRLLLDDAIENLAQSISGAVARFPEREQLKRAG